MCVLISCSQKFEVTAPENPEKFLDVMSISTALSNHIKYRVVKNALSCPLISMHIEKFYGYSYRLCRRYVNT